MSQHEAMTRRRLYPLLGLLGLLIGLLLLLAQGAYADFPHTTDVLLSDDSEPCNAVRPRLARNETGQWLAVSWIQEDSKAGGGCFANGGRALLRWATENTTFDGWQGPVTLSAPVSGGCINHVDVAVHSTTAHVVLTAQTPCEDTEDTSKSAVHHTTCNLTTGSCQPLSESTEIVAIINNPDTDEDVRFLEAYVAVDDANRPHIVYSRRDIDYTGDDWDRPSAIWYTRRDSGGTWRHRELSSPEGAYEPRIAWAYSTANDRGYVHLVWETHISPPQGHGRVRYRRCPDNAYLSGQIDCPNDNPNYTEEFAAGTFPRPALGVSGDRVTLLWNTCDVFDHPDPPCETFNFFYRRSDAAGWNFGDPLEVRTNRSINQPRYRYHGTDEESQEYRYLPRAAVAMNAADAPVVAWQIQNPSYAAGYTLSTTWAISASTQDTRAFIWDETGWSSGEGYDTRVSPDIALPDPRLESQGLHLVFMRQPGQLSNYLVYYSYFGEDLYVAPTPTPESGQDQPTVYLPLISRGK